MRKLIVFNAITLDGYYEGLNHEIDWHQVDDEFNVFAVDQIKEFDAILFGRMTYELMSDYWPTEAAAQDDPIVAKMMNATLKFVFSNTLKTVEWNNTTLLSGNLKDCIQKLKAQPGKDIIIFGSGKLTSSLTELGLIDEFRLMVNSVILGTGHPLFEGISERISLELTRSRQFKSGNVLLTYKLKYNNSTPAN